jgi:putative oligomerization/nucleic acid binding protein
MQYKLVISGVIAATLIGCASPTVVTARQAGDESLSCEQLVAASAEASQFEQEARSERGVTGTNAAAVVFFWPGLIGTYANTADAINAARDRQAYLNTLYTQKGCSTTQASGSSSDIASQLRELRSMYEEGLLSEEEYNAARTRALGL